MSIPLFQFEVECPHCNRRSRVWDDTAVVYRNQQQRITGRVYHCEHCYNAILIHEREREQVIRTGKLGTVPITRRQRKTRSSDDPVQPIRKGV